MIANICVFLSWCFAITSNIKTIESASHQITPIRFFSQLSEENYLRTINNLKTFNKRPIVMKPADRKILSEPGIDSIKKYQLKLKSRHKLEKKGQDIKCSFCVFANSNILNLKNIVDKLISGQPFIYNDEPVKRLEEDAKIILRILLWENLDTGKWLWSYLLKIIAIRQLAGNNPFVGENPFEDDQLQTGVSDFIENCIAKKYLPLAAKESSHLVSKNMSVYNNMLCRLHDSRLFLGVLLDRNSAMIEFLYLKPFWDEENRLLFGQITEHVNVDWTESKRRHEAEVVVTREFLGNRTWMYKPYGRLDHQHLLVEILDARIYCYLSVILHVYVKQLSILDEQTVKYIKFLIVYYVIPSALKITACKDEFLVVVVSELKFAQISDTDDIKDILARVTNKANEILNGLNGASTSGIDWLSFNVDERQLSTKDLIITIIEEFHDFLNELKGLPFEYKALLHFMDVVKLSAARYI